jgi:O-antigen/teichoic acid export membrane protein
LGYGDDYAYLSEKDGGYEEEDSMIWKKGLTNITGSEFIKNIMMLITGNIIGYGINLITLPIISRIYTQSELGEYELILSSAGIFLAILQLSMMLVIMIPEEEHEAVIISKIILYFTLFGSILIVAVLLALAPDIQFFHVNISYSGGILLFGLYLIFYNLQNIYYSFTNRKKLYSILLWNPVLMAAANGFFSIAFGLCGGGSVGYLLGTIISYIAAILHMKRHVQPFVDSVRIYEIKEVLAKYREYPLIQLPAALVSTIALQIPAQFLGRIFSAAVLGGYTMACKILTVPVSLLAAPVNRVYYRSLVEKLENREEAGKFAFSLLKNNILIAVVPIGLLMVFGDKIISIVLGRAWRISGTYILIMGMMYLLKYCSACMSGTFVAAGKQRISLFFSVFTLFLYGVWGFIIYKVQIDVISAIILYTVFASIQEIVNLLLCMYCLRFPMMKCLKFFLNYIIGSTAIIYLLYGFRRWIEWRFLK